MDSENLTYSHGTGWATSGKETFIFFKASRANMEIQAPFYSVAIGFPSPILKLL
jgi:hypothetical protein